MAGTGDPRVAYCSLEDVRDALDVTPSATTTRRITRAILGSSTSIEGLLNRRFYPEQDVRYFDWPLNYQYAVPWRLWLDANEVWSVDRIVTGNRTLTPVTDFILRPENMGPPYSHIEIRVSGTGMWSPASGTWQQAIAIHGQFGGCGDTETAGTIPAAITTTTATTLTVTDSVAIGTLDSILVDTEWMTVVAKRMTSTGQHLAADLNASAAATLLTVVAGTWVPGETLLVDAERVQIVDVADNHLVIRRAIDGTVLAAHTTGTVIYAPRLLTVTRGILGSTAATHAINAPVSRLAVPEVVRNLAIAQSITNLEHDSMGWTTSKGEESRVTQTREIADLRNMAYTRWARQSRTRAV